MNLEEYRNQLNNLSIKEPVLYNDNWVNYNSILYPDLAENQRQYYYDTFLFNSTNGPSIKILFDEEIITQDCIIRAA